MPPFKLPYFDYLLAQLEQGNPALATSFGRHVHWGYWEHPSQARVSVEDFAKAAEELSRQLCISAALRDGMTVLDAGCGFGGTVAHLNENYRDMRLHGLNLDKRQLHRAKNEVKGRAGNQIFFVQTNACALPLVSESLDAVLAVECIFHFPSRQRFFEEAWRVLKPGGRLTLSDFVCRPQVKPLLKLKQTPMFGEGFYGACDFQMTEGGYCTLAAQTGFEMTLLRNINSHTLPTYAFLRSLSVAGNRPDSLFAVLETLTAELLSKTGLLNYTLISLTKPP
jgi:cyclopropane fatty-acyl-phospholipid synthase-like methyltransferase